MVMIHIHSTREVTMILITSLVQHVRIITMIMITSLVQRLGTVKIRLKKLPTGV
jgi:hypothetical protein